jgi:hypothetical protein
MVYEDYLSVLVQDSEVRTAKYERFTVPQALESRLKKKFAVIVCRLRVSETGLKADEVEDAGALAHQASRRIGASTSKFLERLKR